MIQSVDNQAGPAGSRAASLEAILRPARRTRIVDIGANPIDGDPPYRVMLDRGLCQLTGFEPQAAPLSVLNSRKGPHETYLPYAVGDGARHTLNICQKSGMTSLLKPDPKALGMFNLFSRHGLVVGNVEIDTRRLDDIDEVPPIDFLKIDVQGSELSIFRSGRTKLRNAVAIHTEVSFMTVYENQPLFADVDRELRAQGFVPHCFAGVRQVGISPILFEGDPPTPRNQIFEADIVYVRDFSKPELLTTEQLQHLALIAHYCYGSFDLAAFCVHALAARSDGGDLDKRYFDLLVESGLTQRVEIETESSIVSKSTVSLVNLLNEARARHLKGDLADAEELYAGYLDVRPDDTDVLTLLGTLHAQKGDFEKAATLIERSLSIDGSQTFAFNSLGNILNSLGRHGDALAAFDKALALKPDHAPALNNRGTALRALRRSDEALASIDRAIASNPEYAEAFHNRGLALHDLGRLDDALLSFDRAIALRADFWDAYRNRGNALRLLKRFDDALQSYAKAIALNPQSAESHLDEGLALEESGQPLQALARYRQAIALNPALAAAHYNAGNVLMTTHRALEAVACYERAIALRPDYAEAHNNLAGSFRALNRRSDALDAYDRAIAVRPDMAHAHHGRGQILHDLQQHSAALAAFNTTLALAPDRAKAHADRGLVLMDIGRLQDALASFDRALALNPDLPDVRGLRWSVAASLCDWTRRDEDAEALRAALVRGVGVSTPFSLMTVPCSPDLHRRCAEIFVEKYSQLRAAPFKTGASARDKLRIAYVSADFGAHAVASLIAGTIEHHDRTRVEVFGISSGADDRSAMRARLERAFDHFIDITGMSDDKVVTLLRETQIDIAVDLMGFTRGSRLGIFAARAAPIQVNYLGNTGTTGAGFFDYVVADRIVIPEDEYRLYSEKVVYMPITYQPSDSSRPVAQTPPRSAVGLPEDALVFCSFNRPDKIAPEIFDIWMRLLHGAPRSVLWLREWNAASTISLRHHAATRGIAPERIIFAGSVSNEDHLARHRLADLFLDTCPFGAHTTASDALWAGLPLLTCKGDTFAGRVAASLLNAIGLNELVTESLAEYEARALDLANDPAALAGVKDKLQRNRKTHPLFDTARHTRALERAYEHMVEAHRGGRPPSAFAVEEEVSLVSRIETRAAGMSRR